MNRDCCLLTEDQFARLQPLRPADTRGKPRVDERRVINRRRKNRFSAFLYRDSSAIERMFGRLKDFRRIATRCDRPATDFLAAVCIARDHRLPVMRPDPYSSGPHLYSCPNGT